MKITPKPKRKIKITRKRPASKPGEYSIQDAFMEVLMTLPDQKARHVALDAATGVGPGSVDLPKTARICLRAAEKLKWSRYKAIAKLTEVTA